MAHQSLVFQMGFSNLALTNRGFSGQASSRNTDYPTSVKPHCPTIEWTFDPKKDLLIKGKIVNKYFINDTANVFFSVKIESLSNAKTEILMTPVKVGDKKDFSLGGLRVQ
jgi:hypothetical protein